MSSCLLVVLHACTRQKWLCTREILSSSAILCRLGGRQGFAFFDVRVFYPNAESYKDLTIQQIYRKHEDEKKRSYANRVLEVEQGTFTPLFFTTTGSMADECKRFHSRLAELVSYLLRKEKSTAQQFHGYVQKCPLLY